MKEVSKHNEEKRYPSIMKNTTCAQLGLYVLKNIQLIQAQDDIISQSHTVEYINLYVQILELKVQAYMY